MKRETRKLIAVFLFVSFFQGNAVAEMLEGRIVQVDHTKNVFEISTGLKWNDLSGETTFMVRPDTVLVHAGSMRDFEPGDPVQVLGKPINGSMWKADQVMKQPRR